jgi:hypothetical protein
MAQRSTGVFPREKFDLDTAMSVPEGFTQSSMILSSIGVVRVIVLGLVFNGGYMDVTVGGRSVHFDADNDLDINGVGIAYVRGCLCNTNTIGYDLYDGATVDAIYIDAVDVVS